MKYVFIVLIFLLLGIGAYQGIELSKVQKQLSQDKQMLADLNQVNYGLFNLQLWKVKAMDIVQGRMTDFDVDPKIYDEVQEELNDYLVDIYNDYLGNGRIVNQFIDQAVTEGNMNEMFAKLIKQNIGPAIENIGIEKQLPAVAVELTQELKKREPELKAHLVKGFKGILDETITTEYIDPREAIYKDYSFNSLHETNDLLKENIAVNERTIKEHIYWSYLPLLAAALLSLILYKIIGGAWSISLTAITSIVLLIIGVTMPMINIDARLNAFTMYVLDQEVSFDEQFLFYQSKSILEVTKSMIELGDWDLQVVGILVLCFSIVIPFIKLVLSFLTVIFDKVRQVEFFNKIIYNLGKWSMADVFVVALFMAYIGFQGILTNQLQSIERNRTGFAVETLNYSELAPGSLFFTTYCILSIITGVLIKRYHDKLHHENISA